MSVVGFDFGNLQSVVAVARRRGIDVLQNEVGHRGTPSVVAFHGKQRYMGNEAAAQMSSNPANTITGAKRLLGRKFDDPELSLEKPFIYPKLVAGKNGNVAVDVSYDEKREQFAPEQIVGTFLQKLKGIAESGLDGQRVTDCVIGVPIWWNDAMRHALLDAANVAGLNVLRLMNETTAVALNYGILRPLPKDKEQKVLFVDIGHSQTQASLVSFTEGKLVVLGTAYDRNLGGRNFDEVLVDHFAKFILEKYKMDVRTETKAMLKLRKECERVKLHLSANTKVQFSVEYIMNDRDVSTIIERSEFEALCAQSLLPRLSNLCKEVLDKTGVKKEDLHSIEIVGGSIRIPAVQRSLHEYFGRELSKTCDGDESVARGCALMCAMISPAFKVKEFEVHDIHPYPIELQWGPVNLQNFTPEDSTPLFTVNNPIPSVKLISFNDRTEPFMVQARYSDITNLPSGTNPVIGKYVVSGMPGAVAGKKVPKIKVRVKLNLHGVLTVTSAQLIEEIGEEKAGDAAMSDVPAADAAAPADAAKMDTATDGADAKAAAAPAKVKVNRTDLKVESYNNSGLDSATLSAYFEKEAAMTNQDRVIFETNEARNALEAYSLEMRNRVSDELASYVKESDRDAFVSQLQAAEDWVYSEEGENAQKSEYKKRLADLKAIGDQIVFRYQEEEQRPQFIQQLKSAIGHYSQWVQTKEEKYSHIGDEDRKKIVEECNKTDQWLAQVLSQQDRLSKFDTPAVTTELLRQKRVALENLSNPIINKPKPAPPKEEKKEAKKPDETKPAADANAGAAGADETKPMDTQ